MLQHICKKMPKYRPLVQLVLDFDGTLTTKDTLHLVVKAGYDRQKRKNQSESIIPWHEIVDAYIVDYERYADNYRPEKSSRKTIESESAWLNSLKPIEIASAQRVYRAGILDGVTAQDIRAAAIDALSSAEMEFRSGLFNLLKAASSLNQEAIISGHSHPHQRIISVNWSRYFIWSALKHLMHDVGDSEALKIADVMIFANEIPSVVEDLKHDTEECLQPRGMVKDLRSSEDKLAVLLHFRQEYETSMSNSIIVYVGDSSTDLQCLMASDVGICIRDEPMGSGQKELSETLERLKIPISHISECHSIGRDFKESRFQNAGRLWWCRDLQEVADWIGTTNT